MPRSPTESRQLFRQEAIDAQRQKFLGEAQLAQPVRLWVFTAVALIVAALVIAVAIWGQYTRRERVQGYLSSAGGTAVVRTAEAGIITELRVKEGDEVKAGQTIGVLTVDRSGVNDASSNEAVVRSLESRRRLLDDESHELRSLGVQQVDQAQKKVVSLEGEITQIDEEIRLQSQRLDTAGKTLAKWRELQTKDFASEYKVLEYENAAKEQEIRVQNLRRQRAGLQNSLTAARADVPGTRLRAAAQVQQIDQQTSSVNQEIAAQAARREQDVRRDMNVTAPIDGTVTNINPARGQSVAADTTFATILPADSALHAELLVPTRAIGFIHAGQSVNLRYEAFPYERFGQYAGHVESVGKDVWMQGQTVGPLAVREPVYRIIVALDRQSVRAGNDALPLRAGMVASADLLMERRTLLEWLFQPIIQLRERMRGGLQPAT